MIVPKNSKNSEMESQQPIVRPLGLNLSKQQSKPQNDQKYTIKLLLLICDAGTMKCFEMTLIISK